MRNVLLALTLTLGTAAAAGAQRTPAPKAGTVEIRTESGAVRVVGWDRAEVSVSGGRARISRRGAVTRVRPEEEHDALEIHVPAGSRVEVSTSSGSIRVAEVKGAVDLQSMSGSFQVSGSPSMVDVEGLSGSIRMLGSTETLRVKTLSGSISVPRARGFVELTTVSGAIEVASQGVRKGTIRNVSGRTTFSGSVPRGASLHFENTNGVIDLRVPEGVDARFDLSSLADGEIRNEFGPEPRRRNQHTWGEAVRFTEGSGGAEVTARTVNGQIRLRRE